MTNIAPRILFAVPGVFIMATGLMFLTNPEAASAKLLLDAFGAEGLSNLRGLAGAPLFAVGTSLLIGAATAKLEYVRPAALFLLTLIAARLVSYGIDGPIDAIGLFLAIPLINFALLAIGHVMLGRDGSQPVVASRTIE